ncbi:MAG: vWA domain-containing protein [Actinomycetales bacterium]
MRNRYGAWQGGPDPLAPPYDVREAVDAIGRDVMEGRSLTEAIRDLLRRGDQGRRGLDDLARDVRRRRERARRAGDLSGTLDQVRELLDQAVSEEQSALFPDPSDDARLREQRLGDLPRDTSRAVRELADYDWRSPEARAAYDEIRQMLQREVLDQQFAGMRNALQDNSAESAEAMARVKDMLADLNQLLAAHARGEDTSDAFREFMDKHGEFFPDNPSNVDELIDALARQAAAAERLMRSLTPQQRQELAQLMADALGDADLAAEMAALRDNLRDLRPGLDWRSRSDVDGDEPLGYGDATAAVQELADLDALAEQLGQDYPGATLDDVDVEAIERQLGTEAGADVAALRELERELRAQGWLARDHDGLRLTPKALRRLGQTALRRVFSQLEAHGRGGHDDRSAGQAGEPTGAWREWRFGDEQPLDVVRTVSNAVLRSASGGGSGVRSRNGSGGLGGGPSASGVVTLEPGDFAVVETERRSSAAVALCVDLSWSMYAEGRWGSMKQTALALQHLMVTRFPQDALQIIGFDRWARPMTEVELAGIEPQWIQGTNLQQALSLAGRHLRRHPDAEPVVLVVTDGEPTAHLEDDGAAVFEWPTTRETLRRTLREVDLLTRYRAQLNLFMLGDDDGLRRFVDAVAQRSGGRVFTPDIDRLGEYVVADYLRARRRR